MIKLSILIPTLFERDEIFKPLLNKLATVANVEIHMTVDEDWVWGFSHPQDSNVQVLYYCDKRQMSIGEKRNKLLAAANGEYVCFIDDDDDIPEKYIELQLRAIESGCDCASLKGIITTDGRDPRIFEHSLKYKVWRTNPDESEVKYERCPNHLNLVKASIAKQFKFPELYHGEDSAWSQEMQAAGVLKTEYYIDDVLYYYNYISNK